MIKLMDVTPEIAAALATLRTALGSGRVSTAKEAFDVLDDAGVFAEIDERYDYAAPLDVLQEIAEANTPETLDPAELGDTTSADMARHQGWHPRTPDDLRQSQKTSMREEFIGDALQRDEEQTPVPEPEGDGIHIGSKTLDH
jgi:hypothetical protein